MEKVALIELGNSALRLILLNTKDGGYFDIVDELEEQIKVGKDIQTSGVLKPTTISECIGILKMFRKLCDRRGVAKIVCVATSLVREAKNQNSFLDEVYNSCGFTMNLLTVEDEMRATYAGVVNTVDIPKGIIIEIANNTTNIIQYNRRTILNQVCLPFGATSLADEFEKVDNISEKCEKVESFVEKQLKKVEFLANLDPEIQFIGSGTMFKSIGYLSRKTSRYSLDIENNYILSADSFHAVNNFVKTLDVDKTKKLKGVSSERADVVLCGLAIAKTLFEYLHIENMSISAYGKKEGLIYNNIVPEINDKPLSDMMGFSIENIRAFRDQEMTNASQVYALSIMLFKQLKVIHKLHRYYVKPLRIAASLYDSGRRIRFENSEKNSFEIILNSNINGVSQREILIAAFASVCQNLDNFNLSDWVKYKDIVTEDDLDAVRKLGTIIKLAVALDKTKTSVVKDISCDILGDSVIMKTVVEGDATFEISEGMKMGADFKKVFKKYLEVI